MKIHSYSPNKACFDGFSRLIKAAPISWAERAPGLVNIKSFAQVVVTSTKISPL